MTKKIYRTAQGKSVDLGKLMLQNENVRAVGNMNVNARGDLIDGYNRPIDRRTQQVQKQYDRQVTNVRDEPVASSAAPGVDEPVSATPKATAPAPVEAVAAKPKAAPPPQGLAAAIARARQFSDNDAPPQEPQQPQGPKRI